MAFVIMGLHAVSDLWPLTPKISSDRPLVQMDRYEEILSTRP